MSRYVKEERKYFYLMMHSTHFIYGYMALDIWYRTIQIVSKKNTAVTPRDLLYASSHRQDSTYHDLGYTRCVALAGMLNISQCVHHEGSIQRSITL